MSPVEVVWLTVFSLCLQWRESSDSLSLSMQHMQMTIQALQDELRIQRDLNQLFQQDSSSRSSEPALAELTEENFQRLHAEHERQAKELFLLRKTLEEMELRIETQKQTLNARDESIKKLLEMLQSKGLSAKATEEDHERTRRLAEAEMHVHHLESLLEQKEKENNMLREVSDQTQCPSPALHSSLSPIHFTDIRKESSLFTLEFVPILKLLCGFLAAFMYLLGFCAGFLPHSPPTSTWR